MLRLGMMDTEQLHPGLLYEAELQQMGLFRLLVLCTAAHMFQMVAEIDRGKCEHLINIGIPVSHVLSLFRDWICQGAGNRLRRTFGSTWPPRVWFMGRTESYCPVCAI